MANRQAGKIALVTDAGGGIGQATAWLLAERGAILALNDVNGEALEATTERLKESGKAIAFLLSGEASYISGAAVPIEGGCRRPDPTNSNRGGRSWIATRRRPCSG